MDRVLANALFSLLTLCSVAACSSDAMPKRSLAGEGGSSGSSAISLGGSGNASWVSNCASGAKTTVSGTVYDPAGKVPLYNVVVYVPIAGEALPDITEGVTCDKCSGMSARGVAVALSDGNGHFVLENVPDGKDIPLVIQVGKWRRQVSIPSVEACQDNALTDPELTRLPRSSAEGHLPKVAVSTGHSDALECLLRKIGIADSEFTVQGGDGRVDMYVGCDAGHGTGANKLSPALGGASFPLATTLYTSPTALDAYDIVMLSCEGSSCADEKPQSSIDNLKAYGDKGGRIFLDHMHFYWLNHSNNAWETAADIAGVGDDLPSPYTVNIDSSFPKGSALADWLVSVGATPTRGDLSIVEGQYSVRAAYPPKSQRWIYLDQHPTAGDPAVEYMTINTPVELAETEPQNQCGRIVYTDLHVTAGTNPDTSDMNTPFPGGCVNTELSPQEKALEFMLFDLSSCVQQESEAPTVPPIIH